MPPNAVCACPGEVLTYTCIAVGPGRTVWTGSAFDCPSSQNQIVFRHSEFESQSVKRCTDGYVVGKPLFDNNGTFTSQLNVTINAGQSNKVVQCRATSNTIGTSTISVISGKKSSLMKYCLFVVCVIMSHILFQNPIHRLPVYS